jgi:hypothetical protein
VSSNQVANLIKALEDLASPSVSDQASFTWGDLEYVADRLLRAIKADIAVSDMGLKGLSGYTDVSNPPKGASTKTGGKDNE